MSSHHNGIVVEEVKRSFGPVHALRAATLDVPPGSVTALIGPNGSGKSTLMLILASLLKPDSGMVSIAGADPVSSPRIVRSAVGWMPDILGAWPNLSVKEMLLTTAKLHGLSAQDAANNVDHVISQISLTSLADASTRILSRGQKQRLSLARALVHKPSILILDEPASGLDPVARVELRDLVRDFAQRGGCVLISSHVLSELDEIADRAVYITEGETVSDDVIDQIGTGVIPWRIRSLDRSKLAEAIAEEALTSVRLDHLGSIVDVANEVVAADLLTKLVARGVPIIGFGPVSGTIERTFISLSNDASRKSTRGRS